MVLRKIPVSHFWQDFPKSTVSDGCSAVLVRHLGAESGRDAEIG